MRKPSGHLRIVGGQFKGRKLNSLEGQALRPTIDRVRESLFNILDHLSINQRDGSPLVDARVLDRFAGTGALGIEALSRGAKDVWFIDRSLASQRLIKQNYQSITGQPHLPSGIRIGDEGLVGLGQASLRRPFDVIFCDPPYGFMDWEALVDGFESSNLVASSTLLVVELDGKDAFPDLSKRWALLKDRRFGRTRVQIFLRH